MLHVECLTLTAGTSAVAGCGVLSGRRCNLGWLIGVSLMSLFVTIPHAAQDLALGAPARFGLGVFASGLLLAIVIAIQGMGLVLAARGRPGAFWLHGLVAVAWIAGDLAIHGREMLRPTPPHTLATGFGLEWAVLVVMVLVLLVVRKARRANRRRW